MRELRGQTALRAVDLIARKRDGGELTPSELGWFVSGYVGGQVMEGQMAALLMAGVLRGFTPAEAYALTDVMVGSGGRLDLSGLPAPTIDKHSTGGVGDGTTLLVAPLLAAAGARVVKLSGRGLGHSGGTLDKLESIPGFRVHLDPGELLRIAGDVGCVVAAQTDQLVPADRALYALRDVTGTVASTALIASSVMSKKLAAGAGTIVLDVKVGEGAFMPTLDEARALARLCVGIGVSAGHRCVAIVSAMDTPLGTGIGNALEVAECVRLLRAPPEGRLAVVALELAAHGLSVATGGGLDAARGQLLELWSRGAALERLARMIAAQGGDPGVCEEPEATLPRAPVRQDVLARGSGVVARVPARAIGELVVALGAGRAHKDDRVDPAVGIELWIEVGDAVESGQPLATVHARTDVGAEQAAARLATVIELGDRAEPAPTVLEVVRS
ncbi:MAG: thymidine phosphorylase, partial [Egibacteraceae bacterium]